jgi:DNA-binding NarL/FixJ family response regulator
MAPGALRAASGGLRIMPSMPESRRVALVSDDLMFRSQLDAAVRRTGGQLVMARIEEIPEADALFVDLNRDSPHRLGLIARVREAHPEATIVAFCHHEAKDVREAAMRVGASSCITNGALQSATLRLAGRKRGTTAAEALEAETARPADA